MLIECCDAAAKFVPGNIFCPAGSFIAALEWSGQAYDCIRQVNQVIGDVMLMKFVYVVPGTNGTFKNFAIGRIVRVAAIVLPC